MYYLVVYIFWINIEYLANLLNEEEDGWGTVNPVNAIYLYGEAKWIDTSYYECKDNTKNASKFQATLIM